MQGIKESEEHDELEDQTHVKISEKAFLSQGTAKEPLRICCYGSSSSETPQVYLDQAYALGKLLALRGHVCVNGAGAFGCMGAMNQGAADHDGHLVGVIHGMFAVDGPIWKEHHGSKCTTKNVSDIGCHAAFSTSHKRELLIANGDDLQERKKLLVKGADALVVLPGGLGTWDELLEMACARNLGLVDMPIVCININDYYGPIREMFQRGYDQNLIKKPPLDILAFESTALEAILYLEEQLLSQDGSKRRKLPLKKPTMERSKSGFMRSHGQGSMIGDAFGYVKRVLATSSSSESFSFDVEDDHGFKNTNFWTLSRSTYVGTFVVGLAIGLAVSRKSY